MADHHSTPLPPGQVEASPQLRFYYLHIRLVIDKQVVAANRQAQLCCHGQHNAAAAGAAVHEEQPQLAHCF